MKIKSIRIWAAISLSSVTLLTGCGQNFSNGSRMGVVTKLSKKGLIYKSWEGQMNLGGMRRETDSDGNSSMVVDVFEFNVDESCVQKVQDAMRSGRRVELIYRQWAIAPPSIDNGHVIIDVKPTD